MAAWAVALALFSVSAPQDRPMARLRPGDVIAVRIVAVEGYDGEYQVLTDGSVTGLGFGRLMAEGKTVPELQADITARMRTILRDPKVEVVLKSQRPDYVYVSGQVADNAGPVVLAEGLDLRALITGVATPTADESYDVVLFREGKEHLRVDLARLLDGRAPEGNIKLKPNDVVTVALQPRIRVWVTGQVGRPGELNLRPGTSPEQAIAAAGGIDPAVVNNPDLQVQVRRGGELVSPDTLAPGDVISVTLPAPIRITVGGEVVNPMEMTARAGTTLEQAIQRAGGPDDDGTLQDILVVRGQESFRLDATGMVSAEGEITNFPLQDGDAIYVRRNERIVLVLGRVNEPRDVRLEDGRTYHLADIVAEGGGQAPNGSIVRVYVGKRGPDGKVVVNEYQLDRYLKDGDETQNPIIVSGDVVVVGQPKGVSAAGVLQLITSASVLRSIFNP